MDERVLLIYDGDCRFCRFGIGIVHRLDLRRALDFCPFGHPVAEERLSVLPADERYDSFHAATSGELSSGTEAARVTLGALPFGNIAVALGLHNAYPLLARSRSILGRFVPDWAPIVSCGTSRNGSRITGRAAAARS